MATWENGKVNGNSMTALFSGLSTKLTVTKFGESN